MTIGPIQAFVIGFPDNDLFEGRIVDELARLSEVGQIRVVDAVFVMREGDDVAVLSVSDLDDDQRAELRAAVGALVGLGVGGVDGAVAGAETGSQDRRQRADGRRGWPPRRLSTICPTAVRHSSSRSNTSGPSRCAMRSATPVGSCSGTVRSPPKSSSSSGWTSATRSTPKRAPVSKSRYPSRGIAHDAERGERAVDYTDVLRRLAINDAHVVEESGMQPGPGLRKLDPKTLALVRLAALVAVGGAVPSYGAHTDCAVDAGATAAEIVEVLVGLIPIVGLPCVVAEAPKLAIALGYDTNDALEMQSDL